MLRRREPSRISLQTNKTQIEVTQGVHLTLELLEAATSRQSVTA